MKDEPKLQSSLKKTPPIKKIEFNKYISILLIMNMENNKTNQIKPETEIPLQECKKKSKKKKSPRCPYLGCNKKIKHILGSCKCNTSFCQQHRLPHLHDCKVWN